MNIKYTNRSWFLLNRHDDPPTDPPADPPADPATGDGDPEGADKLGDAGKQALDRMKAERNAAAKELKAAQAKLKELEDRDKTDAEKLAAKAESAEKRAADATARAVKAEVRALAEDFADREDAVLNLGDLSKYADAAGDIDTAAIKADLAGVLDRKKHLAKPAGSRNPAPDPSQGRGGDNKPTDYRTAPKAEFDAELAKLGLRPRSYS